MEFNSLHIPLQLEFMTTDFSTEEAAGGNEGLQWRKSEEYGLGIRPVTKFTQI